MFYIVHGKLQCRCQSDFVNAKDIYWNIGIKATSLMGSLYEINGMFFIWLVNLYEKTNFLVAGSAGITACFFALATVVSNVKINNIEVYAG